MQFWAFACRADGGCRSMSPRSSSCSAALQLMPVWERPAAASGGCVQLRRLPRGPVFGRRTRFCTSPPSPPAQPGRQAGGRADVGGVGGGRARQYACMHSPDRPAGCLPGCLPRKPLDRHLLCAPYCQAAFPRQGSDRVGAWARTQAARAPARPAGCCPGWEPGGRWPLTG